MKFDQHLPTERLKPCIKYYVASENELEFKLPGHLPEIITSDSQRGHNAVVRWFPDKNKIIIVCTNSGEIGNKQTTGNRIISDCVADYLFK